MTALILRVKDDVVNNLSYQKNDSLQLNIKLVFRRVEIQSPLQNEKGFYKALMYLIFSFHRTWTP